MNGKTVEIALRLNLADFSARLGAAAAQVKAFGSDLGRVGMTQSDGLAKMGTAALAMGGVMAAAFGGAAYAAIKFESAFAGVEKTVDGTDAQLATLREGIIGMANELPASREQIAAVAAAAGQLGIETDNVLAFSRVMIDLGESTNLSAEEAATALARFANITGMAQTDFDRLGSSIVALGNNFATTEAEIVAMATRIAGAGSQIGLSEADILGFATALSSVGIEAEAGGTAISRVMKDIALEVATGGDNLANFAAVAGMSINQFSTLFRDDAGAAIVAFVEGLGRLESSGQSAIKVLSDMGIVDVRVSNALLASAGATDLMRNALDLSNQAWDENTALAEEAGKRYETTESQLAILRNRITDVAREVGEAVLPALRSMIDAAGPVVEVIKSMAEGFSSLPDPIKTGTVAMAAMLTGGLLLAGVIGRLAPMVADARNAFATVGRSLTQSGSAFEHVGLKAMYAKDAVGGFTQRLGGMGTVMGALAAGGLVLALGAAIDQLQTSLSRGMWGTTDVEELVAQLTAATRLGDETSAVFTDLSEAVTRSGASWYEHGIINNAFNGTADAAKEKLEAVDQALVKIASENPALAMEVYNRVLAETGLSAEQGAKKFDAYGSAVSAAEERQEAFNTRVTEAGERLGISRGEVERWAKSLDLDPSMMTTDQLVAAISNASSAAAGGTPAMAGFGQATGEIGEEAESAREQIEALNDTLRAQWDPLFAMQDALRGNAEAQFEAAVAAAKYDEAVRNHGESSWEAQAALLALTGANQEAVASALDLTTAASTLNAAVQDGDITMGQAEAQLALWVQQGLLGTEQAYLFAAGIRESTGRAAELAGQARETAGEVVAMTTELAGAKLGEVGINLVGATETEAQLQTITGELLTVREGAEGEVKIRGVDGAVYAVSLIGGQLQVIKLGADAEVTATGVSETDAQLAGVMSDLLFIGGGATAPVAQQGAEAAAAQTRVLTGDLARIQLGASGIVEVPGADSSTILLRGVNGELIRVRDGAAGPVSVPGADGSYWQVSNVNGQLVLVRQGATANVSVNTGGAEARLANIIRLQNQIRSGGGIPDPYGYGVPEAHGGVLDFLAAGGLRFFAGGSEDHVAQIAPAGAWRVWAEPETGGEAYVPLAHSKRARSEAIMGVVADRFGGAYVPADAMRSAPVPAGGGGGLSIAVSMPVHLTAPGYLGDLRTLEQMLEGMVDRQVPKIRDTLRDLNRSVS